MVAKNKTSTGKAGKARRTVASLGAELDELRAQMAILQAKVDAMTGSGEQSAAPTTASTTTTSSPKPAQPPAEDPVQGVHRLVEAVFAMAHRPLPDDEEGRDALFEEFKSLIHSDRKGTGLLDQNLRNYTWSQLRKKADIYLEDTSDMGSYTVTRMSPGSVDKNTTRVKLFLKARTRMPTPITLRRDEKDAGQWRVETSSL